MPDWLQFRSAAIEEASGKLTFALAALSLPSRTGIAIAEQDDAFEQGENLSSPLLQPKFVATKMTSHLR